MNNVIGLDAGATHTKVVVWRLGQKVYEASDWPGMNMDLLQQGQGYEYFRQRLGEVINFEDYIWVLAIAGLDNEVEVNEAQVWWRKFLTANEISFKDIKIISDIDLVVWAGSQKGVGVGLIAGTGSNCLGIDKSKRRCKVGGMSHLLSDEGSGFALGWQVLRIVTKMSDGRLPKTGFFKQVLDLYEVKEVVALKNKLLGSENLKAEVARTSQLLIESAGQGDQLASEVIKREILELVEMVVAVNRQMKEGGILPLFVAGSLFKNQYYFENFLSEIRVVYPEQNIERVNPIDGVLNYVNSLR